jgi:hypothetical protein
MKRIAFDSNVVDAIAASPGLLEAIQRASSRGVLQLISTHVQEDELIATPDRRRRSKLLAVYHALPVSTVPTHGFVLDISRLGMARLGDGSSTGVSIDDLDSESGRHRRDALIGVTAAGEADAFVTCERRRLPKRMRRAGAACEIWDFKRFREYVMSQGAVASPDEGADSQPSQGERRP